MNSDSSRKIRSAGSEFEYAVGLAYDVSNQEAPHVELLSGIPLDERIPEDLYEAVALILCELKAFQ